MSPQIAADLDAASFTPTVETVSFQSLCRHERPHHFATLSSLTAAVALIVARSHLRFAVLNAQSNRSDSWKSVC
jgi:hypothetical protein